MKLVMDVHFENGGARAAAVAFDDWAAFEPTRTFATAVHQVEKPPARGQLDLRELPCLLQLLSEHGLAPELIVINGFVYLDAQETAGLGRHLYDALGGQCPILGVSKSTMAGDTPAQFEVYREEETRPLIVTCAGLDLGAGKARLRTMHGKKRVPTLMKLATRLAKNAEA